MQRRFGLVPINESGRAGEERDLQLQCLACSISSSTPVPAGAGMRDTRASRPSRAPANGAATSPTAISVSALAPDGRRQRDRLGSAGAAIHLLWRLSTPVPDRTNETVYL